MSGEANSIFEAAKELPRNERAQVVARLLDTLEDDDDDSQDLAPIDPSWAAEIERRIDDFHAGKIPTEPGQEVMSQLKAKYRK